MESQHVTTDATAAAAAAAAAVNITCERVLAVSERHFSTVSAIQCHAVRRGQNQCCDIDTEVSTLHCTRVHLPKLPIS